VFDSHEIHQTFQSDLKLAILIGDFCGFPQFLQANSGITHYTRLQLLSSTTTWGHCLHLAKHLTLNLLSWKTLTLGHP